MNTTVVEQGGDGKRRPLDLDRELARIEHHAMIEAHRVRSIEYVATAGMVAVSNISSLERTLVSSVPSAAQRLRTVGDLATRAVAGEIAGLLK